jgi:hypothetical protein
LGAAVSEVSFERAIAVMKRGLRIADAIVVDATSDDLAWSPDEAIRAANLALRVRQLEGSVAMFTGARWNRIPIAVLVPDERTAEMLRHDPKMRFVIACVTQPRANWYYPYVDPWPEIYDQIDEAAYLSALERMDEMEALGHRFKEVERGRWIRFIAPEERARRGRLRELESDSYDGGSDRLLLRARRRRANSWDGTDVVLLERTAVERDLYRLENLVNNAYAERDMQRFFEERPYMLGAGAHDTKGHPTFRPEGSPAWYPDFIQRSFNGSIRPKPATIIELKTPRTRILTKTGLDWHWARPVLAGIQQTRRYAEFAQDGRYAPQLTAILGEVPARTKKVLIAGRVSRYERDHLERVRRYCQDVDVRGYDEVYDETVERHAG